MFVILDRGRCTGLGICESVAPEYFEVADDGSLIVLRDDVPEAELELVADAVQQCPTAALRLAETKP